MTKATATQNSASNIFKSSALEHVGDGVGDSLARGAYTDEPFDDRGRGLGGDAAHVRHRRRFCLRNGLLGCGNARVELGVERLAGGFGGGGLFDAGLVGKRL